MQHGYCFTKLGKKIIGAGINYKSVIAEKKLPIPTHPIVFLKPTTSYIGVGECIRIPKDLEVFHEVELGIIMKDKCKNLKCEDVKKHIFGYCLALDLTAFPELVQARACGNPWTMSKGFDTSCPVSCSRPFENEDIFNMDIWLKVNDKIKQQCCTSDMLFTTYDFISYVSQRMTLEPYDLILTGTPAGVGPIAPGDYIQAGLGDKIKIDFKVACD